MSNIIEELFYGNLEPQELTTEITPKLKKKLNELMWIVTVLTKVFSDLGNLPELLKEIGLKLIIVKSM